MPAEVRKAFQAFMASKIDTPSARLRLRLMHPFGKNASAEPAADLGSAFFLLSLRRVRVPDQMVKTEGSVSRPRQCPEWWASR